MVEREGKPLEASKGGGFQKGGYQQRGRGRGQGRGGYREDGLQRQKLSKEYQEM